MDKIQHYLDIVPIWALFAIPILVALVFSMTPAHLRLPLSIVAMVVWLTCSRLPRLGTVFVLAKITSFLPYALVGLCALLERHPRRRLPWYVWLYPVMAAVSFVYVLTVTDRAMALVIRFQWFVLTLAAIFLVRTITDRESLGRVVKALTMGLAVSVLLSASALIVEPSASFGTGHGRFSPYGANPNQIGTLLAIAPAMFLLAAIRTRSVFRRVVWGELFAVAAVQGLLTASRSVVFIAGLLLLPIILTLIRRPVFVLIATVLLFASFNLAIDMISDEARFERLGNLETGRYEIWRGYLSVIADRPVVGLLGTSNQSWEGASEVGTHPHNAYLYMLYLGGLSYGGPMIFLIVLSVAGVVRVWLNRARFGEDWLMIKTLAVLLLVSIIHGFTNGAIHYPTYTWAFVHVWLSVLFMGIAYQPREA